MFTCQAISVGESYLSKHLSANDYYCKEEKVVGRWIGKGAEVLGIEGQEINPDDKTFEDLRTNRDPRSGEKLTVRTPKVRRAFYDFQLSAPKSVSILGVTFGDERLVSAHRAAAALAFAELERFAARRDRSGDKAFSRDSVSTGTLVTGEFHHDASRELDAQLHTHFVCANATYDAAQKKWFALENGKMFEAVAFAGRVYQNELAKQVQALGYAIDEVRENGQVQGFEVRGVRVEDMRLQSTRRAQIETEIAKFRDLWGREPTNREIHVMATETRQKNLAEVSTPEVRAAQRAKYGTEDQARLAGLRTAAEGVVQSRSEVQASVQGADRLARAAEFGQQNDMLMSAVRHLTERKALVRRREVLTHAIEENLGKANVDVMRKLLNESDDVVHYRRASGEAVDDQKVSTVEQLGRELESLQIIKQLQGKFGPLAVGVKVGDTLGDDQKAAVERFLSSGDGVYALIGRAGAGKTYALTEIHGQLNARGIKPLYVAPTHVAKKVLQENNFEGAETVSALMVQLMKGTTSVQNRLVVVDEAGFLSTKQGHELMKVVEKANARVLLVGDEKQLLSVEAGDWMGVMLRKGVLKASVLDEVRRQQEAKYRDAMRSMVAGDVKLGVQKLAMLGWVHEGRSGYLGAAANAYWRAKGTGESVVLVAPTWKEIDTLNASVREKMISAGLLGSQEWKRAVIDVADLTAEQRHDARNFHVGEFVSPSGRVRGMKSGIWAGILGIDTVKHEIKLMDGTKVDLRKDGHRINVGRGIEIGVRTGDVLLLQENNHKVGVINGERVQVIKELEDGGLSVRQEDGRGVVLPSAYKAFVHGYAVTAEKSQGMTVDHAVFAAERIDGRRVLVGTSRGRKTIEMHVPDRDEALRVAPREIIPVDGAAEKERDPEFEAKRAATVREARPKPTARERFRTYYETQRERIRRTVTAANARMRTAFGRGAVRGGGQSTDNFLGHE